ncbi:hypothetical protein E2C01_092683 [Portunus trituberculatus]|uniref:Uncharacterized protein n=1 Tax=Portunus trituberculatus TaxID=210409 RepID=A0A5B7JH21_PORTR|nr:hypothetical protein [Portunus trituberculatus]
MPAADAMSRSLLQALRSLMSLRDGLSPSPLIHPSSLSLPLPPSPSVHCLRHTTDIQPSFLAYSSMLRLFLPPSLTPQSYCLPIAIPLFTPSLNPSPLSPSPARGYSKALTVQESDI